MAGRGRSAGAWRRPGGALAVLLSVLVALSGCSSTARPDTDRQAVRQLLDQRAHAVLAHDTDAFAATGAPGARGSGLAGLDRLGQVPFTDYGYRLTGLRRSGAGATAQAELRYRVDGFDRTPVTARRTLALALRAGHWRVTGDRPAAGSPQQLWDQGPVSAVRGTRSLILGTGQDTARLRDFADLADRAVPAVAAVWPAGWARRVVVLVPRSLDGMAGLLGADAAGYRGIAAVTTGEAGGSPHAPADRIVVNPEAYGVLSGLGRQVVLTHETTHVATRTATSDATPLWLSEGYADWVGYRGSGRTPAQAAPELARALAADRLPARLPGDGDFGFSRDADGLARAYEGGWLACRMIAEHWGEARLTAFYRAVGAHDGPGGALAGALRDVLHTDEAAFTARWRDYLRAELG